MNALIALALYYIAEGVAPESIVSAGTDADLPTTGGPFFSVLETGGSPPEKTHNGGKVRFPSFQVVARARNYLTAADLARAAWDVSNKANLLFDDVFFLWVRTANEPFGLPKDANGRNRVAFNVETAFRGGTIVDADNFALVPGSLPYRVDKVMVNGLHTYRIIAKDSAAPGGERTLHQVSFP